MKYTVVWMEAAQNDLATIWMAAADVTQAAHRIEHALKFDADTKGKEFMGNRLLADQPLAVVFAVSAQDCMVTVVHVQRIDG